MPFFLTVVQKVLSGLFDRLEKRMGTYEFISVFEYILTDRGSELGILKLLKQDWMKFSVPAFTIVIQCVADKKELLNRLTPCFAWFAQRNYFEFLTQWDVNLIVNHINSTPRESLNGTRLMTLH